MFDHFIIVDWSAANARKSNRADCIWIADGGANENQPATSSPASRTEAFDAIIARLDQLHADQKRCFLGFDFAFGYSAGFADLWLGKSRTPAWKRTWEQLESLIQDDIDTKPGRSPSNRSNRFDVANQINRQCGDVVADGPFWCCEPNWRSRTNDVRIPQKQPRDPVLVEQLRQTDVVVNSSTPFCLYRTGSVGSQSLVGIPRLQRLRKKFAGSLEVWPFETGWSESQKLFTVAEIYPSVRPPLADSIKDRGQVRAVWKWARDLNERELFSKRFARPSDLDDAASRDMLSEEGWVLH